MEFKDGVSVYTADGKKAGSLDRVVIDPATKEVTHIVIQKGLLTKEDKVVAVEKVSATTAEEITLSCNTEELNVMSPLKVSQYVPIGEGAGGQNFDPLAGGLSNTPAADRSVTMQTKRTIPDELVALKEGARVISADDDHVGFIEHIFTETETGKVSRFIVSHGIISKTRKSIPIEWVKLITDEDVYLAVGTEKVEEAAELYS